MSPEQALEWLINDIDSLSKTQILAGLNLIRSNYKNLDSGEMNSVEERLK